MTNIAEEDIILDVPYSDKDEAKRCGAKPRFVAGKFSGWYIPKGSNTEALSKWIPKTSDDGAMSLSGLMNMVETSIQRGMPSSYWVVAEVINVSMTKHMYLELSESNDSGQEIAKARASIWASNLKIVQNFESVTGQKLKSGTKVLIEVAVDFHKKFGLSLIVKNIDTKFTIGEAEAKLIKIRQDLINEGIYSQNKELPSPRDYHRVAVISPENAAGLGDFRTTADKVQLAGLCQFDYYHAQFQGQTATQQIIEQLRTIYRKIMDGQTAYDCVILIRGGGSKSDLYELNDYDLARSICLFPIPVECGIGHDRDMTIVDEVSNVRHATPSMVVEALSGIIVTNADMMLKYLERLKANTRTLLDRASREASDIRNEMTSLSRMVLQDAKDELVYTKNEVEKHSKSILNKATIECRDLMGALLYQDPKKILKKGYAIVKTENRIIPDKASLNDESHLKIHFRDGVVDLKVSK